MKIPKVSNEITDSISESWKEKVNTPIYGVFSIWWSVFHWKLLVTVFLVSEDRIWKSKQLLKSDYLSQEFFNVSDPYFWISWIMPFILTYFVIWKFPDWFLIPAFKKDEEDRTKKRKIRIDEQRKLSDAEKRFEEAETEKLVVLEEKVKKEKAIRNIDPTVSWNEEYESFKKSEYYNDFNFLIESVYQYEGSIRWTVGDYTERGIPKGVMAYSHTNGLIEFSNKNKDITLTDKGKFFVKMFSLDNNIS